MSRLLVLFQDRASRFHTNFPDWKIGVETTLYMSSLFPSISSSSLSYSGRLIYSECGFGPSLAGQSWSVLKWAGWFKLRASWSCQVWFHQRVIVIHWLGKQCFCKLFQIFFRVFIQAKAGYSGLSCEFNFVDVPNWVPVLKRIFHSIYFLLAYPALSILSWLIKFHWLFCVILNYYSEVLSYK